MSDDQLKGMAQTVLGPVSPTTLGPTMAHEHLLLDFKAMFRPPVEVSKQFRTLLPFTMENLGWIRYNHYSHMDNLFLADEETAIAEALLYKRVGGTSIIDVTTIGIGRDPLALARIARAAGLNIIMGAGYYVDAAHPKGMDRLTEADISRQITAEITGGVGDTGVKAGIIGEIGCSWPLTSNERKVLRAAVRAQQTTGASISIHPGRDQAAPREILDVLAEAGADLGRTVMGHLDRTVADVDVLMELARSGCYLEYDLFGEESSYYELSDMDMPSDAQRIGFIMRLIAEGYAERIVVGHDVGSKHRLVKYGGHGYGHILENIVPRMRKKGISAADIQAIIVDNPARVLTFV